MRPRTQTLIIGFLIILLVCGHLIKPVTNYLMLPIGRILAFGASAYVGLTVNPVIGMLIALVCLQAMSEFYVVEHMTGSGLTAAMCKCPDGFLDFDEDLGMCKNKDKLKYAKPTMCRCASGYAFDTISGVCKQNSVMSSPIPATAPAPEGAIEATPEPQPNAPAAASVRPMRIELTNEEKLAALGKTPAPEEESS